MYLERLSKAGIDTSPYYQSDTFNKAKGTINDLPNCTCYCMCATYERLSVDKPFKMFSDRSAGGYPQAKEWYSKTTFAKGSELKEGSIAVFDGNYGHVAFVERVIDRNHALISQSQYDSNKSLRNYKYWETREVELTVGKATLNGVGKLIGFVYLPIDDIRTRRDETKEQILIKEEMVNVRIKPDGELFRKGCYVPMGYYNVLRSMEVDGYKWFCLEENHWVREGEWLVQYPIKDELIIENERLRNELALAYDTISRIRELVC